MIVVENYELLSLMHVPWLDVSKIIDCYRNSLNKYKFEI